MAGLALTGKVVGAERVVARLTGVIPARVRAELSDEVRTLGLTLERTVKLEKLQGQVLHRRSGRLVRSINTLFTEPSPDVFTSATGTNLSYGRAWELGFHGTVQVKGFFRHNKGGDVRGRVARLTASGRLSSRRGAVIAQGLSFVHPHSRKVNMNARPFLLPTLDEMRPLIRQRIAAAVERGMKG